jgi:hypothetical protein
VRPGSASASRFLESSRSQTSLRDITSARHTPPLVGTSCGATLSATMHIYRVRYGETAASVQSLPTALRPKTEPLTKAGWKQAAWAGTYLLRQTRNPR